MIKNLNANIIWFGIAIGMLLGTGFFYIGGLQPLILSTYSNNTISRVNQLENEFYSQAEEFLVSYNDIISLINTSSSLDVCSDSQIVDTNAREFRIYQSLSTTLLPNPDLESTETYFTFFDPEIESTYNQIYDKYETSLTELNTFYSNSLELSDFLQFRNSWIDLCNRIYESEGNIIELKESCAKLESITELFSNTINYTEVLENTEVSIEQCNQVIDYETPFRQTYPDFDQWLIDWYDGFTEVIFYDFNTDRQNELETLNTTIQNFSNEVSDTRREINVIRNDKIEFINSFYIMDRKS